MLMTCASARTRQDIGLTIPLHTASHPTDVPRLVTLVQQLLSVPEAGHLGVSMTAD